MHGNMRRVTALDRIVRVATGEQSPGDVVTCNAQLANAMSLFTSLRR